MWRQVGVPVKIGGPAYNEHGGDFVPGRYLKKGYVITSRDAQIDAGFVLFQKGGIQTQRTSDYGWVQCAG